MLADIENIRIVRKRLGLTQSELAKKANVSQSLIAKIESGKLDPTFSKAKNIFHALHSETKNNSTTAKDIMQTKIIATSIDEKVGSIIQKMRKYNISQLPVLNKYVVGIVSEASILLRATSGVNVSELTAEEVMAEAAPVISESTDIETVNSLLKQNSLIIVSKHGELKGVITKADLLKNLYKA